MDTTTLRVSEPRELLAYLPHQLGFQPRLSAVAVSLRPPRGQVGLVTRVDLEDLGDDDRGPQVARALVAHIGKDGGARAVLVLYTPADPRIAGPGHRRALTAAEHFQEAAFEPLGRVPVLVVTATGYLALRCDEPACCPPGGRPLSELESTAVAAQMVLAGSAVAACREDVARITPAPAGARRAVARVEGRWLARGARDRAAGPDELRAWRAESVRAWRAEVEAAVVGGAEAAALAQARGTAACPTPGPLAPPAGAPRLGRLVAALADRRVRDAVLVAMVPGTGDLAERSLRDDPAVPSAEMAAAIGAIIDPGVAVEPPAQTGAHVQVLERVVAHARRSARAPALTLLALLSWWQADGARARVLLDRALGEEPGYTLARLLDATLAAALPPGWVRRGP